MKNLLVLAFLVFSAHAAIAAVDVKVFLDDGVTPHEIMAIDAGDPNDPNVPLTFEPIPVGSTLTLIVHSDANEYWDGGLYIDDAYRDLGTLVCRSSTDDECAESILPAAGPDASLFPEADIYHSGYFISTGRSPASGEWFLIDYVPKEVGECVVAFYDFDWQFPPTGLRLKRKMRFINTYIPDFSNDAIVDFRDFDTILWQWQQTGCSEPDWCLGGDLDHSGSVDFMDLRLFSSYWLKSY